MKKIESRWIIRLCLVLFAGFVALAYMQSTSLERAQSGVALTLEVQRDLERLLALTLDEQAKVGQLAATGEDDVVADLPVLRKERIALLQSIRQLWNDAPEQLKKLDALQIQLARSEALSDRVIATSQESGMQAAGGVLSEAGPDSWEDLTAKVGALDAEAQRQAKEREQGAHRQGHRIGLFQVVLACFLEIGGIAFLVFDQRASEIKQQVALRFQQSEERLRTVLDGVDQAIFMIDPRGNVETWNAGAERVTGYMAAEVLGFPFWKMYRQVDIDAGKPVAALEALLATGRFDDEDLRIRKDGSEFWASTSGRVINGATGQVRGFSLIVTDITARWKAEIELSKRTDELADRNREIHLVLDNVGQGFLTASFEGRLSAEHSRAVETWLGAPTAGQQVWDYLGTTSPDFSRELKGAWENLADGILEVEAILDVLPRRFAQGDRQLLCEYRAIPETAAVLVIVSDVTTQLAREKLEEEQRELVHIFQGISSDRAGFVEFFSEAGMLVQTIASPEDVSAVERGRALHTLKGNARLFGVTSLARACQAIEDRLQQSGTVVAADRLLLSSLWDDTTKRIAQFLGEVDRRQLSVAETDYLAVLKALGDGTDRALVLEQLEAWQREPAAVRLQRIAEQAQRLAEELGKAPLDVSVEAGPVRLPRELWSDFWGAFVHVIRNAVDHGIESPEERLAVGKSARGKLTLAMAESGEQVCLTMTDDGRGLDWDKLRAAALAAKLPSQTRADLIEAMLTDGVTTKDRVSEISGRGVGMAAVRAICVEMGGALEVSSERGFGTRFEFSFPRLPSSAGQPAPRSQRVAA